jgi:hypothetical protein
MVTFADDEHSDSSDSTTKKRSFRVDNLTTYESLVAGGDRKKEILLRRSNSNYNQILAKVLREHIKHKLASLHFDEVNTTCLYLPIMVITFLSAFISILLTSELISNGLVKVELGIVIAILQLLLSIVQSLSKQLNLGGRAGFHKSACQTLQRIYDRAHNAGLEARYQNIYDALKKGKNLSVTPTLSDDEDNEDKSDAKQKKPSDDDADRERKEEEEEEEEEEEMDEDEAKTQHEHSNSTLTHQYTQALEQVDSFVPINIAAAFDLLDSRIDMVNKSMLTSKTACLVQWDQVKTPLYFQLADTITEYYLWPIFIPLPSKSVEKTFADFKEAISIEKPNNADLLVDILKRSDTISEVQTKMNRRNRQRRKKREREMRSSFRASNLDLDYEEEDESGWGVGEDHLDKLGDDENTPLNESVV